VHQLYKHTYSTHLKKKKMTNSLRLAIKEALKNSGHTMAELADIMDIPYNTLNWYLNGYSPMPSEVESDIIDQVEIWNKE